MLVRLLDSAPVRRLSYALQRHVLHPGARRAVAAAVAAALPRASGERSRLSDAGLLEMGRLLDREQVVAVRAWLGDDPLYDPYERVSGYRAAEAPPDVRLGMYDQEKVLAAPYLLELANRPDILALVAGFLGARPTLTDFLAWWSFGGRPRGAHAQLFHRDAVDWRVCKLFVYLTDVDAGSGPHVYVEGTARATELKDLRRLPDEEVRAAFPHWRVLTGPAGTGFMSDPRGIHKALPPASRDRLVFEATYGLVPQPDGNFYPRPPRRARLSAERLRRLDPWVCRRFVDPEPLG